MPITITMPALSPTMTEGTLAKWLVSEGDSIASGDVIAEIETDKATMEVETIDEGTMGRILVPEGTENVAVNTPIALVLEDGEDASALDGYEPEGGPAPAAEADEKAPAEAEPAPAKSSGSAAGAKPAAGPAPAKADGERIFASPLARRIAKQEGLDLTAVSGSGPNGRIVKADVEAAIKSGVGKQKPQEAKPEAAKAEVPAAAPTTAEQLPYEPSFDVEPLTSMRKIIARRLTESKQTVPHFYLTIDVELDALLALRKELNERADGAYKLSVNDLVIKATAVALTKVPAANSSFTDEGIKLYHHADIAVAVASDRGLITPVIRKAETKGLEAISREMKELAGKAREGKLKPEEFQGGTFSISNLGMFGVKHFEAVINPPQSCILAVGAGEQRPVVKDGALAVATVMSCTLSTDHRSVDGAVGAEFLAAFKKLVQDPMTMLL